MAAAYGIPRPTLPVFESGTESDFALLKLALDNLLSHHTHISEQYKYQELLSHLKFTSAQQLAKAYMLHPQPYTAALQALQEKYGQPRQLVQSELGAIMSTPPLKVGDSNAFDSFALSVQSLVGMLRTLEGQNGYELMCGSHVDCLLGKLPPAYRDLGRDLGSKLGPSPALARDAQALPRPVSDSLSELPARVWPEPVFFYFIFLWLMFQLLK